MIDYAITSAALGILLAGGILVLVRRDHLHGNYALWWLGVAGLTLLLGLFPTVVDVVAGWLGITYPPILVVVVGLGMMLLKMLTMDLERSRQERKIRRLAQRIAMLEALPPDDDNGT